MYPIAQQAHYRGGPVDPQLVIGVGSLLLTLIGTYAALVAIRRPGGVRPIQIVGAVDPKPAFRVLGRRGLGSQRKRAAIEVLSRFIFVSHQGQVVVGALDQFNISLFLDLFSASTFPAYRRIIAELIVGHIRATHFHEQPSHIAVPKEGNVLLAAEVAHQLKIPVVIVRTIVPAIRFGDPVEGMIAANACVLVVDDIASDGELLARTVAALRDHGARVTNCFCAVERLDGNSRERLAGHNVVLHTPISLDEGVLRELARLPPEINEPPEHEDSLG